MARAAASPTMRTVEAARVREATAARGRRAGGRGRAITTTPARHDHNVSLPPRERGHSAHLHARAWGRWAAIRRAWGGEVAINATRAARGGARVRRGQHPHRGHTGGGGVAGRWPHIEHGHWAQHTDRVPRARRGGDDGRRVCCSRRRRARPRPRQRPPQLHAPPPGWPGACGAGGVQGEGREGASGGQAGKEGGGERAATPRRPPKTRAHAVRPRLGRPGRRARPRRPRHR